MSLRPSSFHVVPVVLSLLALAALPAAAQVGIPSLGTPVTENFDTLASSGTSSSLPTGWALSEAGTNANALYTAGTGSGTAGDTYSFGAASAAERAFGGLQSGSLIPTVGAAFQNNSGGTITSLDVAYTGEQWRLGALARVDRLDFQYSLDATSLSTGTWTNVDPLDFTAPVTGPTTGALDGNAAANRTNVAGSITGLSIAPGAVFWIRWSDFNATSSDDGLAVDAFSLTANGTGGGISLTIGDVSVIEGDSGSLSATFSVTLSAPAPAGGVTFDIATADGTTCPGCATTADNDYVARNLTSQTIPAGQQLYTFDVTVNGDLNIEPDETFSVDVTNVVGAGVSVADGHAVGTILTDDFLITPIHDVQGPGATSPLVGSVVNVRAVVTGVKSNGFFMQMPDGQADSDPLTSEGIFVFTSSAPPPAAMVGNVVRVTGTVIEFIPTADPLQPPLTEIGGSPTVALVSTSPVPTPVTLTTTFPSPTGAHDQLERLEGMRVLVPSLTVSGPTLGSITESAATATSSGVFYGTVTGVARPFREPGVQLPDALPAGSPCCVPRFDTNPERIRVDSDGLTGGPLLDVGTGAVVTNLEGVLDYSFRTYTLLPDPLLPAPGVSGGPTATAAPSPTSLEFTIASFNLERFFDNVDDPGIGDPVLTATAYNNRLNKASRAIRNYLHFPDVLGVAEVENLTTLQALATRINADAVANTQPDPQYVAYLFEGNDVGGIDVGFLVKTAEVSAGVPRVSVVEVVQEGEEVTWTDPADGVVKALHDRPSVRLAAVVHHPNGAQYPPSGAPPLQVIVNHLRSLTGIGDPRPDGATTTGERVRLKRKLQAEWLANFVQARQAAAPTERIILVGDFNAFEINDGFVDSMGTIRGVPTPDDQTVVAGDGTDLVTPDFSFLFDSGSQRYSFVFDGNAQSLDHVLINQALLGDSNVVARAGHARIGADFPETARNDTTNAVRLSDHDPVIAYFSVAAFPVELQTFTVE